MHLAHLAAIIGITSALLTGCAEGETQFATDEAALVSASTVPGTYDFGAWEDHYGNRTMTGGVLVTTADPSSSTVGTFVCNNTASCPAASGTWVYGQDTTRSRWADFYDSNGGSPVRWYLPEDGMGQPLFSRVLGSKRIGWQRVNFGELFLKR